MNRGLYIHIPFCQTICTYCDFNKFFYNEKMASKYIEAVKKEIEEYQIKDVTSIYIGGGTPTALNEAQLEELLSFVSTLHNESHSFALEANVENLTESKIKILKKYGVNRISIGVQSFNQNLLKIMNRHHTYEEVLEKITLLHKYEIDDINIDLIYGLPTQTKEMLEEDLDKFLSLDVTHISTYALMINKNTVLGNKHTPEASQEVYREFYDLILKRFEEKGFLRYEVSNFAKPGYESKHNLIYWHNEEYYGIGAGASGYIDDIRYTNTRSLTKYIEGARRLEEEQVTSKDHEFYFFMLGLRLSEGVSLSSYARIYNKDLIETYRTKLDELLENKLVEIVDDHLRITKNNLYIMDYILEKLLF